MGFWPANKKEDILSKYTWKKIFDDFKSIYPKLSKKAIYYRPYLYPEIYIELDDGVILIYNYEIKRATIKSEKEI